MLGVSKDIWWLIFHRLDDWDLSVFGKVVKHKLVDRYWGYRMNQLIKKQKLRMDNRHQYFRLLDDLVHHMEYDAAYNDEDLPVGHPCNNNYRYYDRKKFYALRDPNENYIIKEKKYVTYRCEDCDCYICQCPLDFGDIDKIFRDDTFNNVHVDEILSDVDVYFSDEDWGDLSKSFEECSLCGRGHFHCIC